MASLIDRVGCFRGKVVESGVGATSNGYPQFTVRIIATQMYVEGKENLEAFGLAEPQWVDWSGYEQDIVGYLCLFGADKKNEGAAKPTFQLDNVKSALGWDGSSFGTLGGTDWSGKEITFWTEENEYQGNISIRVSTIDAADAPPVRTLRKLDGEGLKDLDSKFAAFLGGKKTAVVAAKAPAKAPVTKAPPAAAGKPVGPPAKASPTPSAAQPATTAAPTATPSASVTSPSKAPPKAPPQKKAEKVEPAPFVTTEMTMEEAWNYVMANKGSASDDAAAEKWIDASGAVAPGKDESTITGDEWAKIAGKTLDTLKAAA